MSAFPQNPTETLKNFRCWGVDHEEHLRWSKAILRSAEGGPRTTVGRRLFEVLGFANGDLLEHLQEEHAHLGPVLQSAGPTARHHAEDLMVDQAVLRNAIAALHHFVETRQDHRKALQALAHGLQAHVELFEQRVVPWFEAQATALEGAGR